LLRTTVAAEEGDQVAKRGLAGSARKVCLAQGTKASGGPELSPALALFAWLSHPEQREAMRRRFIDGKGGFMER